MNDMLMRLYPWLVTTGFVSIILLIVYFFVFVIRVSLNKTVQPSRAAKAIIIFLVCIFLAAISLVGYGAHFALSRINWLVYQSDATVTVDGISLKKDKRDQFLLDMRQIYHNKLSGSGPTQPYDVVFGYDGNRYSYVFKRDSKNKRMYWVYYAELPFNGDIGYVNTDVFDKPEN